MSNQAAPTTALTVTTEVPAILAEILHESHNGLSPRVQYELVKTQIAPGCDDGELALFLSIARSRGLDVFAKQLYARKQRTWDSEKRDYVQKMIIITSIDGFRLKAHRTKELTRIDDAEFTYDEKRISPLNPAGMVKCRVVVHRNGQPFPGTIFWDELRQTYTKNNIDHLNATWAKMPHAMAGKCAEGLALRKAFPEELSNLSVDDEVTFDATPTIDQPTKPTTWVGAPALTGPLTNVPRVSTDAGDAKATAAEAKIEAKEVKPDIDWSARVTEAESMLRACVDQVTLGEAFKKLSTMLPKGKAPAEARQRVGTMFAELETKLPKMAERREPGQDGE